METRVRNKQEILERPGGARDEVWSLGVKRLGIFGSFVRGEQNPESDVDVLVEFEPGEKLSITS